MHLGAAGLRTAAGGTPSCRGSAAAGAGAAPPRARGGAPPPLAQQPAGTQQQGQHAQLRGRRGAATSAAATHAHAQEACPLPAAAFSSALDAGSALDFTWITHWQQQEARRAARRAVIDATRSRQRQRLRQVATLVAGSDAAAALRGAIGGSGGGAPHWAAEAALAGASAGSLDLPAASAQHPSDMDELTWVASHPPEGEAAAGAAGGTPLWSQQAAQQQQHIVGMGLGSAEGGPSGGASLAGPVTLRVGADTLSVRPLWIAVFQPEEGGPAKLFESVSPLLPDVAGRLSADLSPFCSVGAGMQFSAADEAAGGWRNFFVGLVGGVAAHEDDILWPNQVLHRDRVLYNVRNGWDVARFLADPRKEDMVEHRDNLMRIAAERGYRPGWAWHLLRQRWGAAALHVAGLEV